MSVGTWPTLPRVNQDESGGVTAAGAGVARNRCRHAGQCRCARRVQRRHGLPDCRGSTTTVAEEGATPAPTRGSTDRDILTLRWFRCCSPLRASGRWRCWKRCLGPTRICRAACAAHWSDACASGGHSIARSARLCSDRCTNPVASGYRSDRQFAANGGNRVSQVALCAPNFPAQCNRRELQVSGVLRILFDVDRGLLPQR